MLKHFFVIFSRYFLKNKTVSLINLLGLSVSLASSFIILSYVLKETNYDKFNEKKDRVYRVLCENKTYKQSTSKSPMVLNNLLLKNFPDVESVTQIYEQDNVKIKIGDNLEPINKFYLSTSSFFKIFTNKLIYGKETGVLDSPNSIVLTKNKSDLLFPNQNPIGKTVEVQIESKSYYLVVTAVVEDVPENSSYRFNYLANINLLLDIYSKTEWVNQILSDWNFNFCTTFILLKNQSSPDSFKEKWNKYEQSNDFPKDIFHYYFQRLTEIHFNSDHLSYEEPRGSKKFVLLYSVVALVILLVATFNYIMLSISKAEQRLKEFGIKKVVGSSSTLLRRQFIAESILFSLMSFPLAYILVELGIEKINQLFFIDLKVNIIHNTNQLFSFLLVTLFIGVISGIYIYIKLTTINSVNAFFKGNSGNPRKKNIAQNALLVFQIIVFTILMGCSLSISKQIFFLKNKTIGYNRTNKLIFNTMGSKFSQPSLLTFKQKLSESPNVRGISSGWGLPPNSSAMEYMIPQKDHPDEKVKIKCIITDANFAKLLEVKILKGRFFDENLKSDSTVCIINDKAAKSLGFIDPLNEKINGSNIIGVISDFNRTTSLDDVEPLMLVLGKAEYTSDILIDIRENSFNDVKKFVESAWNSIHPDEKYFLNDIKESQAIVYYKEEQLKRIIMFFSLIAIFLSIIALFAQSLYYVKQRRKEIGIRKINGAKANQIVLIFIKKYGFITLIANALSWPLIIYFTTKWQQNFIYKSPMTFDFIIVVIILSMLIVLSTVALNILKYANENPVKVIKYE